MLFLMVSLTLTIFERKRNARKNEVLEKHPYAVWKGKNGFWYTYLPNSTKSKGRELKKRKQEDDIYDLIISYYKGDHINVDENHKQYKPKVHRFREENTFKKWFENLKSISWILWTYQIIQFLNIPVITTDFSKIPRLNFVGLVIWIRII